MYFIAAHFSISMRPILMNSVFEIQSQINRAEMLENNDRYYVNGICASFPEIFSYSHGLQKNITVLSYVYRSAKFINFFACLFILFNHSPMYETFRTESKIK